MKKLQLIITGGHSGMGLELTKKLLAEGHRVGLIIRSKKRMEETLQLISAQENLEFFFADLSKREALVEVAAQIKSKWERIDGIFNNAGVLLEKLYYSDQGNELQFEINALVPFLLTEALKPLLDQSENPFVVNTATSGFSRKKNIDIDELKSPKKFVKVTGFYLSSKFALVLLMNYLSKQWSKIRIVSLHPGSINTKMTGSNAVPKWLKLIFKFIGQSPQKGGESIYDAAFNKKYEGKSGIYIASGKIVPLQYELNDQEVEAMLLDGKRD